MRRCEKLPEGSKIIRRRERKSLQKHVKSSDGCFVLLLVFEQLGVGVQDFQGRLLHFICPRLELSLVFHNFFPPARLMFPIINATTTTRT